MQLDLLALFPLGIAIAIAVVIAVLAGTFAARLFFHATGLDPEDAVHHEKPRR